MGLASVTRLKTPPLPGDVASDLDRQKMRRHILAALLQHGCDGIRGDCYCGLHPRRMWSHMTAAVAEQTYLLRDYVSSIMEEHHTQTSLTTGKLRCSCGDVYDDRGVGREEHWAAALATNLPAPEATRCLTEIRKAGQAR